MIGRWTLQLAAAGARDRGVFEAAAAACLRAIARGMATKAAGSSKGTKGCILNLGLIFPLFLLRAGCHRLPPQACDVIVLLFFPCFFFLPHLIRSCNLMTNSRLQGPSCRRHHLYT